MLQLRRAEKQEVTKLIFNKASENYITWEDYVQIAQIRAQTQRMNKTARKSVISYLRRNMGVVF